jgi:hypothetical protein
MKLIVLCLLATLIANAQTAKPTYPVQDEIRAVFVRFVAAQNAHDVDVPSAFFGGKSDWAVYMTPGAVDVMRSRACTRMQEYALLDGAGHWLQQEQPNPVCSALVQQYGTFATALVTFSQFPSSGCGFAVMSFSFSDRSFNVVNQSWCPSCMAFGCCSRN